MNISNKAKHQENKIQESMTKRELKPDIKHDDRSKSKSVIFSPSNILMVSLLFGPERLSGFWSFTCPEFKDKIILNFITFYIYRMSLVTW